MVNDRAWNRHRAPVGKQAHIHPRRSTPTYAHQCPYTLKWPFPPVLNIPCQATKFLNPKGWTLEVTLEVADATVGGLAIAVGMTTHSHRAGLMQETVRAYDIVTADGSLLHCTVCAGACHCLFVCVCVCMFACVFMRVSACEQYAGCGRAGTHDTYHCPLGGRERGCFFCLTLVARDACFCGGFGGECHPGG